MRIILLCALIAYAHSQQYDQQEDLDFDQQQVQQLTKNIKGGSWEPYNPSSADLVKIFDQRHHGQGESYNMRQNLTSERRDLDVGVCYIEVPTASLVRDGKVPAGNGSQPHLSRIRSCCRGYIRNIHNFRKCDPVCTQECVNALCTAPETCTCFPDHVKNLAGFCIPTCPIGCQNGNCAGGECLCKDGFKLDADSKYCVPVCQKNCGGIGNCTAPNTCDCKAGYETTPDGACRPHCDKCENGDCVAPNECYCHQGFARNLQGVCAPVCQQGYETTSKGCKPICRSCVNGDCVGPNECKCHDGYARNRQGQCVAQCSPDCGPNSRCVSPNVCDPPIPVQPIQPYIQPSNDPVPFYPDSQNVVPLPPNGVPQCDQPCLNGYCIGGNRCNCNSGYVPDKAEPNKCMPSCPGGCPNGVCSAPNFCICNAGYYKDHSVKGRPTCVKRAKRSVDSVDVTEENEKPINVAQLLIFDIPNDY